MHPIKKRRQKKNSLIDIKPFTERPSRNKYAVGNKNNDELAAAELFSFFTADIIKKNIIFTR